MAESYFSAMEEIAKGTAPRRGVVLADWEETPAIVSRKELFNPDLSPRAKLVSILIQVAGDNARHGGDAYRITDSSQISEVLGMSKDSVESAVLELSGMGIIEVIQ